MIPVLLILMNLNVFLMLFYLLPQLLLLFQTTIGNGQHHHIANERKKLKGGLHEPQIKVAPATTGTQ